MKEKLLNLKKRVLPLSLTILILIMVSGIDSNKLFPNMNKEIIFISSTVVRTPEFEKSLPGNAEIVYLSSQKNGIKQITEYLSMRKGIDAVRIISHGNEGYFVLDGDMIDSKYIAENGEIFREWGKALTEDADIMLYGCKVAATDEGKALVKKLAELTGADVAAATEVIGGLLANWTLDYKAGNIETTGLKIEDYEFHLKDLTIVTSNADSGEGTLRQAIESADYGAYIVFDISLHGQTITLLSELIINKDLTIDGDYNNVSGTNITISGGNSVRVFFIVGSTVNISKLNITNGKELLNNGGGIYVESSTVNIDNCTISGCSASNGGGVFSDSESTTNITNSTISGCSAEKEDENGGGGIYNNGSITITNSTISGCSSIVDGGGVFNSGTATITNSTISECSAEAGGGIINTGTIEITNSTISGCSAPGYSGGGVYNSSGTATIINSTISECSALGGGGVYGNYGTTMITNSTISGCSSTNPGGGICLFEGFLNLKNNILINNINAGTPNDIYRISGTLTDDGYNIIGYSNIGASTAGFSETSILYNTRYGSEETSFSAWSRGGTVLSNQNLNIALALANNGGTTQTLAISKGSFAIGAGGADAKLDQRGTSRHSLPTIGAYEPDYLVWAGYETTDWSNYLNWESYTSPTSDYDVFIPDVTIDPVLNNPGVTCTNLNILAGGNLSLGESSGLTVEGDLNIESAGILKIESNATSTGSLIVNGTPTISGTASAERYMTGNAWHVVSPTFSEGDFKEFLTGAGNSIPSKIVDVIPLYGMMDYNESENIWDDYYFEKSEKTLDAGKGYCIRRTSDGVVTFPGKINSGTQSVTITRAGVGWNCIGNPYTSAIKMNDAADETNNFINVNASNLDGSYACVYVWDPSSSTYKIITTSGGTLGQNYLQSGQGFFVKSKEGGATISFTPAMQTHQPETTFKSAEVQWPGFELMATINGNTSSASITFNENMTIGLDVTYDAGLFRGSNGVDIYTRLVEDNGVDFAIQSLPDKFESLVIPLGIESSKSGDLVLSSAMNNIPDGWTITLEDRQQGTMTKIDESFSLEIKAEEGMKSNGRFYIHISNNEAESGETTSSIEKSISDFKAYFSDGFIYLSGEIRSGSTLGIYDIGGRKLGEYKLRSGRLNSIPASDLRSGIYLLRVKDGDDLIMKKVVVKQ